jgi:hypothetical protein
MDKSGELWSKICIFALGFFIKRYKCDLLAI